MMAARSVGRGHHVHKRDAGDRSRRAVSMMPWWRCASGRDSAIRQQGAAAIELAAIMTISITLLFGVIELSRAVQQYSSLVASARAAARLLTSNLGPDGIERARCLAVYGRAMSGCEHGSTGAPLLTGLTIDQVRISLPSDLRDTSGILLQAASAGLASIQARTADGTAAGTIDVLTVTLGPSEQPYRFSPLLPGWVPSFAFSPVSVSMAVSSN